VTESQRELLVAGASTLGVVLDDAAVERFWTYLTLLQRWGRKINLTTRLETTEVIVYHFLDSLAGVPLLEASPAARVIDLGAGAGLPSLPVKFALPGLHLLLVESVRKKVAFCQEAIRAAGLAGIEAMWVRGEELGARADQRRAYDWAISRALGSCADVAKLALPLLAPGGRVLLYKGDPDSEELRALDALCREKQGTWELRRVAVPHLKAARSLIVISFPQTCPMPRTRKRSIAAGVTGRAASSSGTRGPGQKGRNPAVPTRRRCSTWNIKPNRLPHLLFHHRPLCASMLHIPRNRSGLAVSRKGGAWEGS